MVTLEEFKKLEIKVAQIKEVKEHPNADKLYVINIDLGDKTKQIVAGIRGFYKPDELLGRQIIVVDNLQPVMLRGVESQAMLLAAQDEKGISVLMPDRELTPGSVVK
jgi:methionyl-tRNA synthetase